MDNLKNLDLNLLRTLSVLLAEHNVSRAAERLHLSQPSVSVQLAKLRDMFKDPLLLPGPRGMRPTARAESYGRKWCFGVRQGFEGGGGLAENVACRE